MKNMIFLNVTNHEKNLPYYLYGAATEYDQEVVNRPKGCPWFQLNICSSGRGILKMNNRTREIHEGDSMIIFPDVPHEYSPTGGKMIVSWIAFDGFQVQSMFKAIGIDSSDLYRLNNNQSIHQAISRTLAVSRMDLTEQGFEASSLVYSFLLTLMKGFPRVTASGWNEVSIERLKPAIRFMELHLCEPIGIEDIAASIKTSPQHFCQLFKAAMNQRPFEYLNVLRIKHSKYLIINNKEMPLKEISRLSGYGGHSYFCQIFKKLERVTPAEFRRLYS